MVKKRRKKSESSKLNGKLDVAWSKIVKLRAGMRCEKCGEVRTLNSHHIIGRVNKQLRWNLENGCCLCVSCHKFSPTFSAHQTPTIFTEWVIGMKGEDWHDDLVQLANQYKKWTLEDKKALLSEFKQMLNGLE